MKNLKSQLKNSFGSLTKFFILSVGFQNIQNLF